MSANTVTSRTIPYRIHEGEVKELRRAEGDVVIAPSNAAPALRLQITNETHYRALEKAQSHRLPVRALTTANGIIKGLQVPVPAKLKP